MSMGGAGNDQITITRNGSATGFRLDGLMTLLLCGGEETSIT
jgi:hypothetical protein